MALYVPMESEWQRLFWQELQYPGGPLHFKQKSGILRVSISLWAFSVSLLYVHFHLVEPHTWHRTCLSDHWTDDIQYVQQLPFCFCINIHAPHHPMSGSKMPWRTFTIVLQRQNYFLVVIQQLQYFTHIRITVTTLNNNNMAATPRGPLIINEGTSELFLVISPCHQYFRIQPTLHLHEGYTCSFNDK